MIKNFHDRESERVFRREFSKKLPHDIQRAAARRLRDLHIATSLDHLRVPPSNRLEGLKGDRAGQHSIRINDQWRICFEWRDGDAHRVEICDYH
jgi:proteic killer suppression protein